MEDKYTLFNSIIKFIEIWLMTLLNSSRYTKYQDLDQRKIMVYHHATFTSTWCEGEQYLMEDKYISLFL
jgi:hypothetical protein